MSEDYDRRRRFDKLTRARICERLSSALSDSFPNDCNLELEVNVIIGTMERYAKFIPATEKFRPERQQRRQERINSLAAHVDGIIEQIKALDSLALGYSIFSGCEEISKIENNDNPIKSLLDSIILAENLQDDESIKELEAFSLGLRKAAKELPKHCLNTSGNDSPWYAQGAELSTALALESLFFNEGIEFTVSNNGLAAECLRAIYNLGGLNIDRVDYWLKKAKNHYDSMNNNS